MVGYFQRLIDWWRGLFAEPERHDITLTMRECAKCVFYTKRTRSVKRDKDGCVILAAKPYCRKWAEPIDTPQVWCSTFISKNKNEDICK